MRIQQIKQMIEKAKKDEERTSRLWNAVRDLARRNGVNATPQHIEEIVSFVRSYIERVPYYLEQGAAAAAGVGLAGEMQQILAELEAYWFEPDDLVPDRFGLIGLMDDAYASLVLLQGVSDYCRASVGRPLIAEDLAALNQFMRPLLGVPIALQLEQRVGITIGQAMMQRIMSQLAVAAPLNFSTPPDPMYGSASINEIVNARLGAMGVV